MRRDVVQVFDVTTRSDGRARQYRVRWTLNCREHSEGFTHAKMARAFRADLESAVADPRERRSRNSGLPLSATAKEPLDVPSFLRFFVSQHWRTYEQSSRRTLVETLCALVPLCVSPGAPPFEWKRELVKWLCPEGPEMSKEAMAWVERWALDLDDLDVQTLFRIDAGLRLGRGG